MVYIFDTNVISLILRHYYPSAFPSFWEKFDASIARGVITSVRDVQREIENWENPEINVSWIRKNEGIFTDPSPQEEKYAHSLMASPGGEKLKKTKRRADAPMADTWIIAKAHAVSGTVVTQEKRTHEYNRSHASRKIPDICDERGIPCINLKEFMSKEEWRF